MGDGNMATMKLWSRALLLPFFLASAGAQATSPNVAIRVTIRSRWMGYSPQAPIETELLIQRTARGYQLSGTSSHENGYGAKPSKETYQPHTVPTEAIEHLVAALRAPPQAEADIASLGLSGPQLQRALDSAMRKYAQNTSNRTLQAKLAALRESLRQPEPLAATITRGFSAFHTDDYPNISVKAELADHTTLSAKSKSQQYLMLPWTTRNGEPTYAPAIANALHALHALHALMPSTTANRNRLSGPFDPVELDQLIDFGLSEPLERIGAEIMAGTAMQVLSSHFKIGQPAYIKVDDKGGPWLSVELQHPGSPDNLGLYAWLPLDGDRLIHAENTLARLDGELTLVEATPSVMQRVRATPHTRFVINDRSDVRIPYRNIAAQFVSQIHAMHKLPELKRDGAWAQDAVLLDEGDLPIRWMILPDHRAVLWKRYSDAPATPGTMRCSPEPDAEGDNVDAVLTNLCEGIVYGADGTLEHRTGSRPLSTNHQDLLLTPFLKQ